MEERRGEAFAGTEQLTVIGRQLHAGDLAPDFRLDYLDLADLAIRTVGLADSAGMVRRLERREQPGTPALPACDAAVGNSVHRFAIQCLYLYGE
jgi:hypothetical protein